MSSVVEEHDTEAQVEELSGATPPRFEIGLTPLGRPAINITDSNGNTAGYVFSTPEELSGAVGHLQAILTMMITSMYTQRMADQQVAQSLIGQKDPGKIWTP
jgi:hypothetical protein